MGAPVDYTACVKGDVSGECLWATARACSGRNPPNAGNVTPDLQSHEACPQRRTYCIFCGGVVTRGAGSAVGSGALSFAAAPAFGALRLASRSHSRKAAGVGTGFT